MPILICFDRRAEWMFGNVSMLTYNKKLKQNNQLPITSDISSLIHHIKNSKISQSTQRTSKQPKNHSPKVDQAKVILQTTNNNIKEICLFCYKMLKESFSYSIKKALMKVNRFMPALNNSLILTYQASQGRDSLAHISLQNEILFTHNFDDMIDTFGMLNDHEVIILLIDLLTYEVKLFNHFFKIDTSCQVKLQIFYQTKFICICQNGTYNHHLLKLTYYSYPLNQNGRKEELQPYAQFQTQEGDWTYEYTIRKGNSHSMIIWYKSRHDDEFQLKIFDLRNDPKGIYRVLKIKNTLGEPYGIEKINCALQQAWEMKTNMFCLVATTDKTERKCFNPRQNVINNFIWDVDHSIIRQARFQLPSKFNPYQIDTYSSGQYSMFRSLYFQQGQAINSPSIFITNNTEEIYETQISKFNLQDHWQIPGYSDCMFVQGKFENYGVSNITITTRLLIPRKILSYHLLSQSQFQCFDSDLLNDIIGLLDYQS